MAKTRYTTMKWNTAMNLMIMRSGNTNRRFSRCKREICLNGRLGGYGCKLWLGRRKRKTMRFTLGFLVRILMIAIKISIVKVSRWIQVETLLTLTSVAALPKNKTAKEAKVMTVTSKKRRYKEMKKS